MIPTSAQRLQSAYQNTLLNALANPTFARGVNLRGKTQSTMARYVAQRTKKGVEKRLDHPVTRCLTVKCNEYSTPNKLFQTLYLHRDTLGNGYAKIIKGANQVQLIGLNPLDVMAFRMPDDTKVFYIESEKNQPNRGIYFNHEIYHCFDGSVDGFSGVNLLTAYAQKLGFASTLNTYAQRYISKVNANSGFLKTPSTLTPDQYDAAKADIARFIFGAMAGGNDEQGILPFGIEWQGIPTVNHEHTKLIEMMRLTDLAFAQITEVEPELLYIEQGDRQAAFRQFVQTTIRGLVENDEQEMMKLLTDDEISQGYFIGCDEDSLLRGDPTKIDQLLKEVNAGTLSVNEYRTTRDLGPVEGGDVMRMPVAVSQPIENTGKADATEPPEAPQSSLGEQAKANAETFSADGGDRSQSIPELPTPTSPDASPLLADVAERVETKASKAFGKAASKDNFVAWRNVFAEQQASYLRQSIKPVADAFKFSIDLDALCRDYANAIKTRKDESNCDLNEMIQRAIKHG